MGKKNRKEEKRRGEEEKEEDEEEEKKKGREEERKIKNVWNYEFLYEFPCNCMVSNLSPNLGFCLDFILTLELMKVRLVKP